jgi:hypothetical protein
MGEAGSVRKYTSRGWVLPCRLGHGDMERKFNSEFLLQQRERDCQYSDAVVSFPGGDIPIAGRKRSDPVSNVG